MALFIFVVTTVFQGLSVIGVQQIDRVVEVVEETFKGICFCSLLRLNVRYDD